MPLSFSNINGDVILAMVAIAIAVHFVNFLRLRFNHSEK
jgi:hypothetical protein